MGKFLLGVVTGVALVVTHGACVVLGIAIEQHDAQKKESEKEIEVEDETVKTEVKEES